MTGWGDRRRRLAPRSLTVRLTAVTAAILVSTTAITVFLTYELAKAQGRDELDRLLRRERTSFEQELASLLPVDSIDDASIAAAVEQYLATHPGTESHLKAVTVGDRVLVTERGPDRVLSLLAAGPLPEGAEPGTLSSVGSDAGSLRVLSTPLLVAGERVGGLAVYGDLEAVLADARTTAGRIALAGLVAATLGVVLIAVTTRRALTPLQRLSEQTRAVGSTEDLTRRVETPDSGDEIALLARDVNAMLERLDQAAHTRTELFASVSHELRTPVAVARGHVELLSQGLAEDPERSLRVVASELQRTSRLLDDLLILARSDAPGLVHPVPVELEAFADELRLRIEGLDLADSTDVVVVTPGRIEADPDRLAQVVLNLVRNAHEHTPEPTRCEVRLSSSAGAAFIEVSDDGPGLAPDVAARALEPFVAGERPDGRRSTGLGLAVVASVVKAHGGSVSLASDDSGTTATIRLPEDGNEEGP
jgi:signal transduction histidine kinase